MADHLAIERDGGHLLRDLGLIVVLLELCGEQRAERGGLSAEATRSKIAARASLTVDRIDDRNHVLERAGVLRVERRRAANGGRTLPSTYTLHEAPPTQSRKPVPAGPQNSTDSAANRHPHGREPVLAGPRNRYAHRRPRGQPAFQHRDRWAIQLRANVEVDHWFRPSASANSRSRQASPRPKCLQEGCKHSVLGLATTELRPDWRPRPASRREQGSRDGLQNRGFA